MHVLAAVALTFYRFAILIVSTRDQSCRCSVGSVPKQIFEQVTAFYDLRNACPVLRLAIPDELVEKHLSFTNAGPDSAHHCSVPFLAYRNGCLSEFTNSMHRFAFHGAELRKEITKQYKSDLRETWVFKNDETSRFKEARRYLSRHAELDVARWLESQDWQISSLEMYGGQFDIEGSKRDYAATAFEVKFLAQQEVLFELNRASFMSPEAIRLSMYSPMDYLLFRLYQAARQLQTTRKNRIAVAVVSDYDLSFRVPLQEGWINWKNPSFLKRDAEIQEFLSKEYKKNPNLDADIKAVISELNEIWILRYKTSFELQREHRIQLSQT